MKHDAITEARTALQEAAAQATVAGNGIALDKLASALERVASALEQIEGVERQLAAQQAILDRRVLRIETNRLYALWTRLTGAAMRAYRRAQRILPVADTCPGNYSVWTAHEQAGLPAPGDALSAIARWAHRSRISVLLQDDHDGALIASLRNQVYPEWELCVDPRGLNAAADASTGSYVALIDGPGLLPPFALYYCAEALRDGACDVLYADEDHLDDGGGRVWPVFKPDWSPVLLRSCMYVGRFALVHRERFRQAGGVNPGAGNTWLHDLMLRMAHDAIAVRHVPRVLFHRKTDVAACGPSVSSPDVIPVPVRMTAVICSRSPELAGKCLESIRRTSSVISDITLVAHEENGPNEALRATARRYGAAIVPFTGAFNFAAMSNAGAATAGTEALLFLNDDVQATRSGWAEALGAGLAQPSTGIAGGILRYPDGSLQHAGLATGIVDGVGHTGRYASGETPLWPWLLRTREVSAVTGACLAIRTELFRELGGFDPVFPNNYNDVDLCFRCRALGFSVICAATEGLIHAECQTRRGVVHFEERYRFYQRWRDVLSQPDPWYSTSLAPAEAIALNLSNDQGIRGMLSGGRDRLISGDQFLEPPGSLSSRTR